MPKKDLVIALPLLGNLSLQIHITMNRIMKNTLQYGHISLFSKLSAEINNVFRFKDKIPSVLRSGIIYKFQCGGCNYDKTKRYFRVRMYEHLSSSTLTWK